MVTSFVFGMLLVIVIVNRIGEGWQEKNGLLTCPYGGKNFVDKFVENI